MLAELGSASAERSLRGALNSGSHEIRLAVMRRAPHLVDEQARTEMLLHALESATPFDGLDATLSDRSERFHPPPIVDALWRGLDTRPGDVAVHYAAMLAFIYGKADSAFDWSMRPLFLKFNTVSERRATGRHRRAPLAPRRRASAVDHRFHRDASVLHTTADPSTLIVGCTFQTD